LQKTQIEFPGIVRGFSAQSLWVCGSFYISRIRASEKLNHWLKKLDWTHHVEFSNAKENNPGAGVLPEDDKTLWLWSYRVLAHQIDTKGMRGAGS